MRRRLVTSTLLLAVVLPLGVTSAEAGSRGRPDYYRSGRDCTPTNGPYGFYGNLWCQPANESSYLRNLAAQWPMPVPPSLRNPKPSAYATDW